MAIDDGGVLRNVHCRAFFYLCDAPVAHDNRHVGLRRRSSGVNDVHMREDQRWCGGLRLRTETDHGRKKQNPKVT